jgi:hypothetical protein
MQNVPALKALDHLLLGAADLDAGISWVETLTGVRPAIGGSHPGMGTRNALLSLGGRQYLEVIAPDPKQTQYTFHVDVRGFTEPRLVTWAALSTDIDRLATRAAGAGLRVSGPRDGSRLTPDGRRLQWRTLGITSNAGDAHAEPVPFLIQWSAGSVHPSQDSPAGCRLQSFVLHHPDPERVADVLRTLGLEADVRRSDAVGLTATLDTPRGSVELG